MLLERFFSKEIRRRRGLAKAAPGIMHDFLATPFPDKRSSCQSVEVVALDLETTGLDPKRDNILSFGLVLIKKMTIHLDTSEHQLVCVDEDIPEESAVIHQITDDIAARGMPLREVLPNLLRQLAGRIMLAHYARMP